MKHCDRCNLVKPLTEFKNDDLITGYGRVCISCKCKKIESTKHDIKPVITNTENIRCPICNSIMVVRERRSDKKKFYGCTRYPKCKGTSTYPK